MALTLAATDGALLDRVRRILGQREIRAPRRAWSAPLALALIAAALVAAGAYSYAQQAQADGDDPFGTVDFTNGSIDQVRDYESAFRNAVIGDKVGLVAAFLRHGYKIPAVNLKSGVGDILSDAAYFTNDPKMVRLLLDHGVKPAGDPSDWHATINQVLKNGNKEIADMLIAAGAAVDPDRYDAATGNVDGLKKRDAQKPLDAKKIDTLLDYAVKAGQVPAFDWLWAKAQKPDTAANAKKLADFYDKAAENGRLELLMHLETIGVKPADGGAGALEGAIAWNKVAVARHLFDKGVKLKSDPAYFRSPLAETAGAALRAENRIEMVTLLLDHGADINAKDKEGMTALSWAAYCGKDAVCKLLIERGADVDIPDKYGRTAAWYMAGSSHCPEALEAMLKKGAKIKWTDSQDWNLLGYAMNFVPPQQGVQGFPGEILTPAELRDYEAREEKVIDLLVSAGLDPSGKEGTDTPLKTVLVANHYPAARALLRHHPNLNIKDAQGNPAITYLFQNNHTVFPHDVLETMLQQGADPNGSYPVPGLTPVTRITVLQTAIGSVRGTRGNEIGAQRAVIKTLLDHGAKFPGLKSDADQAMLIAAAEGSQEGMKAALAKGASPDAKDSYGYSPLLLSMTLQYFDNVVWLLNNGANPRQNSTIWGNNLIPAAVDANRLDMVKLLISKGLKPAGYELNAAVEHGNREMFDTLIKAGADPKSGSVFTCMQQGQPEMGKIFLDGGADPQPPAFGENRANVYWAVYYNQPVILKAMLDHGADPTYISAYGESPLSEAQEWHSDMVPMIEEALKRWPHLSPGGEIPPDMKDLAQKAADDLRQGHFDQASTK
ncbi:MAG TPA: ankyrin repeat domain-containing protein, partial [Devosia sp.]